MSMTLTNLQNDVHQILWATYDGEDLDLSLGA